MMRLLSDLDYKCDGLPDTYRAQAMRRALLVPFFGPEGGSRCLVARHVLGKDGLLWRWRNQLKELSEAAEPPPLWRKLSRRCAILRNCRPTLIVPRLETSAAMPLCGLRHFCPFCYGRSVGDLYDTLEWALFLDPNLPRYSPAEEGRRHLIHWPNSPQRRRRGAERPRLVRSTRDLIVRVTRVPPQHCALQVGEDRAPVLGLHPEASALPRLIDARVRGRPYFGRPLDFRRCRDTGVVGAYEHFSIGAVEPEFADNGRIVRPGRWTLRFRQILVVPHDWDDANPDIRAWLDDPERGFPTKGGPRKARWKRIRKPDRRAVALAVGKAAAYDPVLLNGPVHRVLEILEARHRRRLSATFGVLRNATARRRAATTES